MALVGEADFLRDQRQRPISPPHQSFCAFYPPLDDEALCADADRLFERAAEVTGAQTGDVGEGRKREGFIKMRFYVVAHAPQPLGRKTLVAGRQGQVPDEMLSSHLTAIFRRETGVTPGRFRAALA